MLNNPYLSESMGVRRANWRSWAKRGVLAHLAENLLANTPHDVSAILCPTRGEGAKTLHDFFSTHAGLEIDRDGAAEEEGAAAAAKVAVCGHGPAIPFGPRLWTTLLDPANPKGGKRPKTAPGQSVKGRCGWGTWIL